MKIPKGYRELKKGEKILKGDLYSYGTEMLWSPTGNYHHAVLALRIAGHRKNKTYIRKITDYSVII